MSKSTGIQWTDHSWNPWHGCIKVSPGCKLCYMYREKKRYGQEPDVVVRSKSTFGDPLKWPETAKVFTCSWSDFFIEQADEWRPDAWDIIRKTPHLTYQILTKRPERIAWHLPADWGDGYPNVWLGVSTEDQEYANERIPLLLQTPAAVHFVSYEPALGPCDFSPFLPAPSETPEELEQFERDCIDSAMSGDFIEVPCGEVLIEPSLNWIIAGGETGSPDDVRFTDNQWLRKVRDECKRANVPFFLKQITSDGYPIPFDRWPEDLRVREFPK